MRRSYQPSGERRYICNIFSDRLKSGQGIGQERAQVEFRVFIDNWVFNLVTV